MASNVIKEFLVKLGFVSDDAALKKLTSGVAQAGKSIALFGAGIEAIAFKVEANVIKFANNLEQLYFASQRTQTSAQNLKAFDRTMQEFGASAGEGIAAVQNFAQFLRSDFAADGKLAAWFGVNVTDPKTGQRRQLTDVLMDVGRAMQHMQPQMAQLFGKQIGMSPDMIWDLQQGGEAALEKFKKIFSGIDGQAKNAHAFGGSFRHFLDVLDSLGRHIFDILQNKVSKSFDALSKTLSGPAGKKIADLLGHIAEILLTQLNVGLQWIADHPQIFDQLLAGMKKFEEYLSKNVKPALEGLFKKLGEVDAATGGWAHTLLLFVALGKLTGLTSIAAGLLGIGTAMVRMITMISMAAGFNPVVRMLTLLTTAGFGIYELTKHNGSWDKFRKGDQDDTYKRLHPGMAAGYGGDDDPNDTLALMKVIQGMSTGAPGTEYGGGKRGILPFTKEEQDEFEHLKGYSLDPDSSFSSKRPLLPTGRRRDMLDYIKTKLADPTSRFGQGFQAAHAASGLDDKVAAFWHVFDPKGQNPDGLAKAEASTVNNDVTINIHGDADDDSVDKMLKGIADIIGPYTRENTSKGP